MFVVARRLRALITIYLRWKVQINRFIGASPQPSQPENTNNRNDASNQALLDALSSPDRVDDGLAEATNANNFARSAKPRLTGLCDCSNCIKRTSTVDAQEVNV